MVNFALALIPEETLQATIDKFLKTKTTSSTADRRKVRLGIWVGIWVDPISIPLLQVLPPTVGKAYANVIQTLIDQAVRIGDTASVVGMYQLLTALRVIRKWADTEFCTWIGDFLANIEIPSQ
ncbi:hypothetical protein IWW34DRAFT_808539 [Fusarium oxysporum f. sp. albedinis]|nr:hypothetical protein IWW34DRAFT_808539 [Fusarium oxysporum f. sp. albedinis]